MKTEPESKITKKCSKIGHFRVPKTLTFKMRLGAQPFLWKWVLFAWEWKMISISKGWAPTLVLTQRPGGTRNWPLRRRFLRSNAVVSRSCFELMLWMNNSSKKIDREVIYWKFVFKNQEVYRWKQAKSDERMAKFNTKSIYFVIFFSVYYKRLWNIYTLHKFPFKNVIFLTIE